MATIRGKRTADILEGTAKGDTIRGRGGDDVLSGLGGNDRLKGGSGNDTLEGGTGNDRLLGGIGDDILDGGADNDLLIGGAGNDRLDGGTGNDILFGDFRYGSGSSGSGSDSGSGTASSAEAGSNDYLDGGAGNDVLFAQKGDDVGVYNVFENAGFTDIYDGGRGYDTLRLELTAGEFADPDIQADIAAFQDFLAANANPRTDRGDTFHFSAFDLAATDWEALDVVITNEAPTDLTLDNASVAENADGAVIGVLTVADPDPGDVHDFTVSDARFEVIGRALKLKSGDTLDFETEPLVLLDVTATDAGGASVTRSFSIAVTDRNDAPVANPDTAGAQENGAPVPIDVLANDTDQDAGEGPSTLRVVSAEAASGAAVAFDGLPGAGISYFPDTTAAFETLGLGQTSNDIITYTIEDDGGFRSTSTVTVVITGVNDAPVASNGVFGTDAATPLTAAFPGDDIDADDNQATLTYVVPAAPANGTVTNNNDGTFTFDPGSDFRALAQDELGGIGFSYQAVDRQGEADFGIITIEVTGLNDAPTAADQAIEANEDTVTAPVAFAGDDVDSDDTAASLIYAVTAPPAEGSVILYSGGTFAFDPGDDFHDLALGENRTVSFSYNATDSRGALSNTATVTVTVNGANDAPVIGIADTTGAVSEIADGAPGENIDDRTATGSLVFTDVDLSDGHVTDVKALAAGYRGNLEAVVSAPATGGAQGLVDWTFTVNDAELDDLAAGETLIQTYRLAVEDGKGGSDSRIVEIELVGSNDPVVIEDDKIVSVPLNYGDVSLEIAAPEDGDGDAVVAAIVSLPDNGDVRLADGTLVTGPGPVSLADLSGLGFTPTSGVGTSSLVYRVTDAGGASAEGTVRLDVTPDTLAEVIDFEDAPLDATGRGVLPDGYGGLVWGGAVTAYTAQGATDYVVDTLDPNDPNIGLIEQLLPQVLENGLSSGTVFAVGDLSAPIVLTSAVGGAFDVSGVNAANPAEAFQQFLGIDGSVIVEFFGLENGLATQLSGPVELTGATQRVDLGFTGIDALRIEVTVPAPPPEYGALSDFAAVFDDFDIALAPGLTLQGAAGDDILVGGSGDDTIDGGAGFDKTIYDGSELDYTVAVGAGGVVTVTGLRPEDSGTDVLTDIELIEFSDYLIDLTNAAPVAQPDAAATAEDTPLLIPAAALLGNDTDVDGPALFISQVGNAVGGTVELTASGDVLFVPTPDLAGLGSFEYRADDGRGGRSTTTVSVDVAAVADAPALSVFGGVGLIGTTAPLDIAAALGDLDGSEALTVEVSGLPSGVGLSAGTFDPADGTWTLVPAQLPGLQITTSASVAQAFTITVSAVATEDLNGDRAVTAEDLDVVFRATNAAPALETDKIVSVPLNYGDVSLEIAAPEDGDGDAVVAAIVSLPDNGDVRLADGTLVTGPGPVSLADLSGLGFTPTSGVGTSSLVYRVTDAGGASAEGTVRLDVTPDTLAEVIDFEDAPLDATGRGVLPDGYGGLVWGGAVTAYTAQGATDYVVDTLDPNDPNIGLIEQLLPQVLENGLSSGTVFAVGDLSAPIVLTSAVGGAFDVSGVNAANPAEAFQQFLGIDGSVIVEFFGLENGLATQLSGPIELTGATQRVDLGFTGIDALRIEVTVPAPPPEYGALSDFAAVFDDFDIALAPGLTLQGATGDDILVGGSGDDTIDGGAGFDKTIYDGSELDYTVAVGPTGAVTVTGLRPEDSGTDVLTDMELIEFSDYLIDLTNAAPVAQPDAAATAEDTPLLIPAAALLGNDTDVDGPALFISQVGNAVGGTVELTASGDVLFVPTPDLAGLGSFEYRADDGRGGRSTTTVSVDVAAVADAPTLSVFGGVGLIGTTAPLDIAAALGDLDGSEALTVEVSGLPSGVGLSAGTFDPADGTWTLVPAQLPGLQITTSASVAQAFTITVSAVATEDLNGDRAVTAEDLDVVFRATNAAPEVETDKIVSVPLNYGDVSLEIAAPEDGDGDAVVAAIVSLPDNGDVRLADGTLVTGPGPVSLADLSGLGFTPTSGVGTSSLVYRVTDAGGASAEGTVRLDVTPDTLAEVIDFEDAPLDATGRGVLPDGYGGLVWGGAVTAYTAQGATDYVVDTLDPNDPNIGLIEQLLPQVLENGLSSGTVFAVGDLSAPIVLTSAVGGAFDVSGVNAANPAEAFQQFLGLDGSVIVEFFGLENGLATQLSGPVELTGATQRVDLGFTGIDALRIEVTVPAPPPEYGALSDFAAVFDDFDIALAPGLTLQGATGDDILVGGRGDDTIDGGDGDDTTILSGDLADYLVSTGPDGVTVEDRRDGGDGTDTVSTVEAIRFADVEVITRYIGSTVEDTPALLLAADLLGPDGIGILSVDGALSGSASLVGPDIRFDPAANFGGTGAVTYTLDLGGGATRQESVMVVVTPVADAPDLSVADSQGLASIAVPLNVAAALVDTDGSELLSVEISGVPAGMTLSAGTPNGTGDVWTLDPAELADLSLLSPAILTDQTVGLTVAATATEGTNGDTATTVAPLSVDLVARAPVLSVADAVGEEDTAIPLTIQAVLPDPTATGPLAIRLEGVPDNATLNNGVYAGPSGTGEGTIWELSAADLVGLTITPPSESDRDFTFSVTAYATDTASGEPLRDLGSIAVTVDAVADTPLISATTSVGDEDTAIPLNLTVDLNDDFDGSERTVIRVEGVPADGRLLIGGSEPDRESDGSYLLEPGFEVLSVQPPLNSNDDFVLTVTATSTETPTDGEPDLSNNTAVAVQSFTVVVNPVNDPPTLEVPKVVAVPFHVPADLNQFPLSIAPPVDPEGDPMTATILAVPNDFAFDPLDDFGRVRLADGTEVTGGDVLTLGQLSGLGFTPGPQGANTQTSVVYEVSDGAVSSTGEITLAVGDVAFLETEFRDPNITDENGEILSGFLGLDWADSNGQASIETIFDVVEDVDVYSALDGVGFSGDWFVTPGADSGPMTITAVGGGTFTLDSAVWVAYLEPLTAGTNQSTFTATAYRGNTVVFDASFDLVNDGNPANVANAVLIAELPALASIDRLVLDGASDATAGFGLDDVIVLQDAPSFLFGDAGNDILIGGTAADEIAGGPGDDLLDGGPGDDLFVFTFGSGNDTIDGFQAGTGTDDRLDLRDFQFQEAYADTDAFLADVATETGGDTTLQLDAETSVTLTGVLVSQLQDGDFLFV